MNKKEDRRERESERDKDRKIDIKDRQTNIQIDK